MVTRDVILVAAAIGGLFLLGRAPLLLADPDWSRTFDLRVRADGGLYAARAANAAHGHDPPAGMPHDEVPAHTALVRAGLALAPGLAGARLPGLLLGLLTAAAAGGLAGLLGGSRAGLLAGLLVALAPTQLDADLSASPYSLVALGVVVALLAVAAAARAERPAAVAGLAAVALVALAAAAWVRAAALVAAPGVLAGLAALPLARAGPSARRRLLAGLAGLAAVGAALVAFEPHLRAEATKHVGALTPAAAAGRALTLGQTTGLVAFALGPFLLWPIGLGHALRGLLRGVVRPAEVGLHALVLTTLGYLALLRFAPLRYSPYLVPGLAVLAALTLGRLGRGERPWPAAGPTWGGSPEASCSAAPACGCSTRRCSRPSWRRSPSGRPAGSRRAATARSTSASTSRSRGSSSSERAPSARPAGGASAPPSWP